MQDFVALNLDRHFIEPQVISLKEALLGELQRGWQLFPAAARMPPSSHRGGLHQQSLKLENADVLEEGNPPSHLAVKL